jgi:methyl-accepting chemotaxis protein
MTEIQSVIKRSSEYSRSVVHLAKEAKGRSEEGSAMMNLLSQAVHAVKLANQELEEIKKIFQKIEAKTAVVNNISFKTQLLSFNASIEAARAGANGRGFSVVALEVGRLADMSAKAADEIGGMLKESVGAVADIVERLSSKVDEASRTNTAALGQFSQIVSDINDIKVSTSSRLALINVSRRCSSSAWHRSPTTSFRAILPPFLENYRCVPVIWKKPWCN